MWHKENNEFSDEEFPDEHTPERGVIGQNDAQDPAQDPQSKENEQVNRPSTQKRTLNESHILTASKQASPRGPDLTIHSGKN